EAPVAVEAGGRVYVVRGESVRRYALKRFAARPRVFTADSEAPDICVSTGKRPASRGRASGVVECRVLPVDTYTAAILYADDTGAHLREEVAIAEIEERLRDARDIVRTAEPPAVLAVRLADELEAAVRRAGPRGSRVRVAVRGALPLIEVEIGE